MIVSILGCGWFGMALAQSLVERGITVKGSTTTPARLSVLAQSGIQPYLIDLHQGENNRVDASFFICDVLVVANNVKLKEEEKYLSSIHQLMALAEQQAIPKIIFISSTSVYADADSVIDERAEPAPVSVSGKLLREAEQLLQDNVSFSAVILRFAGLIGPGRDPARFFAGKTDVPNGLAPVNLIHQKDCVGITDRIIDLDIKNAVINGVCPHHPTKMEFYTKAAEKSALERPLFIAELNEWKQVESIYTKVLLNYHFKIDNLLEYRD